MPAAAGPEARGQPVPRLPADAPGPDRAGGSDRTRTGRSQPNRCFPWFGPARVGRSRTEPAGSGAAALFLIGDAGARVERTALVRDHMLVLQRPVA